MSRAYRTEPGGVCRGRLAVPGDKSISHRVLMLGAIARGRTRVSGLLEAEDCLATRDALLAMGAAIERIGPGEYRLDGVGPGGLRAPTAALDCGNSGTGMRLLAGLLAGQNVAADLLGDASLMTRPMERVAAPLRAMGATITTGEGGCPPLALRPGPGLSGTEHRLRIASAQVKSALLLAGLGAQGWTRVVEPSASRDHTERLLGAFGCPVEVDGLSVALHGPAELTGTRVMVPGDPSSAAFFAVAATLLPHSCLTLQNVGISPRRSGFLDILALMGADIRRENERFVGEEPVADLVVRSASLRGIDVPPEWVARSIDEFPVLFIAAAAAHGSTRVTGAAELRVKESDRLATMAAGLATVGIETDLSAEGIVIHGGRLGGGHVVSHGDHRVAMAFAVAGAVADAPIVVDGVANVATSFPDFAALARNVGLRVSEHSCG